MTVPVNLAYAAAANALKASGTIVKVEPRDFVGIVGRCSDPLVVVAVTVLLSAIALGAAYIPALRASKVDPMQALRYD